MEPKHTSYSASIRHAVHRSTVRLYARLAASRLGRLMTSYRRFDGTEIMSADKTEGVSARRGYRGRPRSLARLRLAEALRDGWFLAGLRGIFSLLYRCPLRLYGLFFLIYGTAEATLSAIDHYMNPTRFQPIGYWVAIIVVLLLSMVALLSNKTLHEAAAGSCILGWVLGRFFAITLQQPSAQRRRTSPILFFIAAVLGIATALGRQYVSMWLMPVVLLLLILCGFIFPHPEAGVLLTALLLPAIWLSERMMPCLLVLIFLTWLSYGTKRLLLHRTTRPDALSKAVLIVGLLLLLSGLVSTVFRWETATLSFMLFLCLSEFFLIVDLMTTRAQVIRCLMGVWLSTVVTTLISLIRHIPITELDWLAGSVAGDSITELYRNIHSELSIQWRGDSILLSVLLLPWLCALLFRPGRLMRRVWAIIYLFLNVILLATSGSISAIFCMVCLLTVFFLLMGNRGLSSLLFLLPLLFLGGVWLHVALTPLPVELVDTLSTVRLERELLWESSWQIALEHPAGVGLGIVENSGNLFFEVLHVLGWQGLLVCFAMLFLFWQKGMTAMRYTVSTADRACVVASMTSILGMLLYGATHSFLSAPGVLVTVAFLAALGSAYANVIMNESDVRDAESMHDAWRGMDCLYRRH